MHSRTDFIPCLPKVQQAAIALALQAEGIEGEDLERGLESRICDLEDTIDVYAVLEYAESLESWAAVL